MKIKRSVWKNEDGTWGWKVQVIAAEETGEASNAACCEQMVRASITDLMRRVSSHDITGDKGDKSCVS